MESKSSRKRLVLLLEPVASIRHVVGDVASISCRIGFAGVNTIELHISFDATAFDLISPHDRPYRIVASRQQEYQERLVTFEILVRSLPVHSSSLVEIDAVANGLSQMAKFIVEVQ